MSTHPYIAYELARSRQEEVRRQMLRPRRPSRWRNDPSIRQRRYRQLRARSPRPAPAR